MHSRALSHTDFSQPTPGWDWPAPQDAAYSVTPQGMVLSAGPDETTSLEGSGVHTRNGDTIELHFSLLEPRLGRLRFGFSGGFEYAVVTLDLAEEKLTLSTTDWSWPQPIRFVPFRLGSGDQHVLTIDRHVGRGDLVKMGNLDISLDGERVLREEDLNLLPEMGVTVAATGTRLLLRQFIHRGAPSTCPEYLHVGGWQMPNVPSIEGNLQSLYRGLRQGAELGVQLLLTPETSLTGLFATDPVTQNQAAISEAEAALRQFLAALPNAPYLVAGLPVWRDTPENRRQTTRYNASRVYAPDGTVVATFPKIHSCEMEFWHGYRLQEFDVYGAPVCMHICHDGRYPEVWTLPVMFGARLILHPANGGQVRGSIDAFEALAKRTTSTSHAFYANVNGGGGSYLVGPQKFDNLIAVSKECERTVSTFPMVGEPGECLLHARLRIADAYGYWPMRSFRASEEVASAYLALYRALGGTRQL